MSFGELLSKEFIELTKDGDFCEVELFTKLQDSFINISKHYPGVVEVIHGRKSFVDFKCTATTYMPASFVGVEFTRELSDMMFIVFSKSKNDIRLMYLQNKKGLTATKFRAELLQLNLLKEHLPIISANLPPCVFGNENILQDAILPSVAAYGVFYQNAIDNKTDMAYYPANNLVVKPPAKTGKYRNAYYDETLFEKEFTINGYKESQGEANLSKFGNALIDMLIGTPVLSIENPCISVLSYLHNFSSNFRESKIPYNRFDNSNHNSKDISIPFTCIINADRAKEDIIS